MKTQYAKRVIKSTHFVWTYTRGSEIVRKGTYSYIQLNIIFTLGSCKLYTHCAVMRDAFQWTYTSRMASQAQAHGGWWPNVNGGMCVCFCLWVDWVVEWGWWTILLMGTHSNLLSVYKPRQVGGCLKLRFILLTGFWVMVSFH